MGNVKFYEPHEGVGGAVIPLPGPVREAANGLDGRIMPLEEGLASIRLIVDDIGGTLKVVDGHKFINYELEREEMVHSWRLIRYEPA